MPHLRGHLRCVGTAYQKIPVSSRQIYPNLVMYSKATARRGSLTEQLKLPEVAHRLGVSEKTARRYIKSGTLPSVFVGGAYRVSEEDLDEYLQNARVMPGITRPKAHRPLSAERALEIADPDHFRLAVEGAPTEELQQTALELAGFTKRQTREELVRNRADKKAQEENRLRVEADLRIGIINVELYRRGEPSPVELVARRFNDAMTPPEELQEGQEKVG